MSPTLTLAVLNDFLIAKLPLLINITAPYIDVTAPFINVTAPSIDITAPPIDITAPSINVTALSINITAPSIKVTATINYSRDLVTLVKIYIEESKYSREDDNFNCKLIIFNNLYNRVSIL